MIFPPEHRDSVQRHNKFGVAEGMRSWAVFMQQDGPKGTPPLGTCPGRGSLEILGIYLYLLSPSPRHLSR
eukprot:6989884-Prymnesium_polylepis.1